MEHIDVSSLREVSTVTLRRGKVNALSEAVIDELQQVLLRLERDSNVKAVILTGEGKFFSFGFDIPEFLSYTKDAFNMFLVKFTELYSNLYLYPKPVIAAVNGHAIAGGFMLALACDFRIMAQGRAKISLNEITFGGSIFAGCVEMLRTCIGQRNAERMLLSGDMYLPDEALSLGLIDQIANPDLLQTDAQVVAHSYASKDVIAFRSIKRLLRGPILDTMRAREEGSIQEFSNIWYSESTWKNLEQIQILG